MARIAVVGSNMIDLVTYVTRMPSPGETLEAPSFAMGHGGKGANQAVAASRLGSQVAMVTKVGTDQFAEATVSNFKTNGIDTKYVTAASGPSGVASIFVEESGENAILIVKGANNHLAPRDIELAAEELRDCRLILLQLEVPTETVYHVLEWAHANGVETVLNPAPAVADLDPDRIRHATFLVPNESELSILTGLPVDTIEDVSAAAETLIEKGVRTVVVTMGSRGALMVSRGRTQLVDPISVETVDTTGAGDAFIGSFAHFYAETGDVDASLSEAARYAALSITRRGTQTSYLSADEFAASKKI